MELSKFAITGRCFHFVLYFAMSTVVQIVGCRVVGDCEDLKVAFVA